MGVSFGGCPKLESIEVCRGNASFKSVDGHLYSKNGKTFLRYGRGQQATSFVVPSGVTRIGMNAFSDCDNLSIVTIPDSIKTIEDNAFYNCAVLASVKADDNDAYQDIDGVLFRKKDFSLVCYPSGKTDSHYTIPRGASKILSTAFQNNPHIISVTIPEGVTRIFPHAFTRCRSLDSVTVPTSVKEIDHFSFVYRNLQTICGKAGSYAENYAERQRILFKAE